MSKTEIASHWQFAAGQALARLRELVRSFDFLRLADGHTYTEFEPAHPLEVIDGFLGEPDGVVFGGGRRELQQLRQVLVDRIQPAYQEGLIAGRQRWQDVDQFFGSIDTEELHRLALQSAPPDDMLSGWFAEGFCRGYAALEFESLRSDSGV